ncbi:MAG TPA: aminoglycoside phosphotransferase family protein [Acidimicrobiales bacterium]|nr:aminoglycoside phosphotransferase family protein [Acidimicrobiales bacterium]
METVEGPVDVAAAARFLNERYGSGVKGVAELGAGAWSRAFAFRLDGRDLVARFGQHRYDVESDEQATSYAGPDLPVPAVLEIGEALGAFYCISERHFGVFLETLDHAGWQRVLPALCRALDALRAVDPGEASDEWTWRGWLLGSLADQPGNRMHGWRASIQSSAFADLFARGEREMRSLLDCVPEARCVLHRDLLNRNVLVTHDGERIEAVFDWGCSIVGDQLYELALLTFFSPWYPALAALDIGAAVRTHYETIGLDEPDFDRRLRCYELHVGLEHLGGAVFTGREDYQQSIAARTLAILEQTAN